MIVDRTHREWMLGSAAVALASTLAYLVYALLSVNGPRGGSVMGLVFGGRLKPVIGATLPLAEIREGHRMLEEGSVFGKIVLEL